MISPALSSSDNAKLQWLIENVSVLQDLVAEFIQDAADDESFVDDDEDLGSFVTSDEETCSPTLSLSN